jgi:hypothetical protein
LRWRRLPRRQRRSCQRTLGHLLELLVPLRRRRPQPGAGRRLGDKRLHAVGGGLRLTGDGDEAHAVSTSPIDRLKERGLAPDDGWRSVGYNSSGSAKKLVAHAICIRK